MRRLLIILFAIMGLCRPVWAGDPAAAFTVKLFADACMPNMGQPEKTFAWAKDHNLSPVTNPPALEIFIGEGRNGNAWVVPDDSGSFALSIRGITEACAVWAQKADPAEIETAFTKLIENLKRPGIDIKTDKDISAPDTGGHAHFLTYDVSSENGQSVYEFTMVTAEQPGGAFQATLQVAKTGLH